MVWVTLKRCGPFHVTHKGQVTDGYELFREIQNEMGFAALFISHDLAVVDMLAEWVGVLYKGKMVEQGIGHQVMGNTHHDYTKRLLASLPVPNPAEQAQRRATHRALLAVQ